jgi:hypothetical protein
MYLPVAFIIALVAVISAVTTKHLNHAPPTHTASTRRVDFTGYTYTYNPRSTTSHTYNPLPTTSRVSSRISSVVSSAVPSVASTVVSASAPTVTSWICGKVKNLDQHYKVCPPGEPTDGLCIICWVVGPPIKSTPPPTGVSATPTVGTTWTCGQTGQSRLPCSVGEKCDKRWCNRCKECWSVGPEPTKQPKTTWLHEARAASATPDVADTLPLQKRGPVAPIQPKGNCHQFSPNGIPASSASPYMCEQDDGLTVIYKVYNEVRQNYCPIAFCNLPMDGQRPYCFRKVESYPTKKGGIKNGPRNLDARSSDSNVTSDVSLVMQTLSISNITSPGHPPANCYQLPSHLPGQFWRPSPDLPFICDQVDGSVVIYKPINEVHEESSDVFCTYGIFESWDCYKRTDQQAD